MTYQPKSDPMTADEACNYISQWGSYLTSGDPGYIAHTAIPPERAAHRDEMVSYLRDTCRPIALENGAEDGDEFEWSDVEQIDRAIEYLEALAYAPDMKFIASSFGGGWIVPIGDAAREYLERLLGDEPAPLMPLGGESGWIIEPQELVQFRADVAADGMTILEA